MRGGCPQLAVETSARAGQRGASKRPPRSRSRGFPYGVASQQRASLGGALLGTPGKDSGMHSDRPPVRLLCGAPLDIGVWPGAHALLPHAAPSKDQEPTRVPAPSFGAPGRRRPWPPPTPTSTRRHRLGRSRSRLACPCQCWWTAKPPPPTTCGSPRRRGTCRAVGDRGNSPLSITQIPQVLAGGRVIQKITSSGWMSPAW